MNAESSLFIQYNYTCYIILNIWRVKYELNFIFLALYFDVIIKISNFAGVNWEIICNEEGFSHIIINYSCAPVM